jgi:adenine-specific DNA methylase
MNKTFLETVKLPVEKLNPLALAEGNAKRPIYRMHKWWARRLGSVFRAILLATFEPADGSPEGFWKKYVTGTNLERKVILDPFMGGGTTLVEALRLGARVIGVDLNPVAWFITKKEIEPVDIEALNEAFRHLDTTAGTRIRKYYRTTCPDGHPAEVMYYFWVKQAPCLACGARIDLFPNYELSRRENEHVSLCPRCYQVIVSSAYNPQTKCQDCNLVFDPKIGVAGRGNYRCPQCQTTNKVLDAIRAQDGVTLKKKLHALEGFCATCGRFFKRVDEEDLIIWDMARKEFFKRKGTLSFPSQMIPWEGRADPRPINHGYTRFMDLFNERQLLSLSILLEEIRGLPDENVRELMLLAFSDCLDSNNIFCKYEVSWHKISKLFGLHAYHPIERPTENNVWGTKYGRGTFTRCFEKVRRGKLFGKKPSLRLPSHKDGRRYNHIVPGERAEGNLVSSFDELIKLDRGSLLRCQSSIDLSFLPDRVVDAVITDPPYFDNVQYSELADFFYVWLRLALKDRYPWFSPLYSSRDAEIVKNEQRGKTLEFFNEEMRKVFSECRRVLKDDGVLAFTFHHNQLWAWEGIAETLLNSGFYVSASPVLRSEGKSGFHSSPGNIRYDCVLVCRKQPAPLLQTNWDQAQDKALQEALRWTERTIASGMAVTQADVSTILLGQLIKYYTQVASSKDDVPTLGQVFEETEKVMEEIDSLIATKTVQPPLLEPVRQLSFLISESQSTYRT